MKTLRNMLLLVVVASISSCHNNDNMLQTNPASQIVGTYKGTLTSSITQTGSPATTEITSVNDYTVGIRCYSIDIDTTIVLELYPDGNMMRVCFTDNDFENEYGHGMSANHHMMGSGGNWTTWQQHMSNEHTANDKHYGYFDMNADTFDYAFNIKNGNNSYVQQFVGKRQ